MKVSATRARVQDEARARRKPRRARSLVGSVVETVGLAIASGHPEPGKRLPIEAEWCVKLGVSRTVLREAISVLESKGMIEAKPRVGSRVCPRERWQRLDEAVLRWQVAASPDDAFVSELFELRRLIEPRAAALAATRADPLHIQELEKAYQEMVANSANAKRFLAPDSRFHQVILDAVGNTLIRTLGSVIASAVNLSLALSLHVPGGQSHSLPLHRAVLDAIAAHQADAADRAMRRVIDDAELDARRGRGARGTKRKGR